MRVESRPSLDLDMCNQDQNHEGYCDIKGEGGAVVDERSKDQLGHSALCARKPM